MNKTINFILVTILVTSNLAYAKSTTETISDVFAVAVPATAYGATVYLDDKDGQMQFYKSYGVTMGSTFLLKYTVKEKRPDSNNKDSFPSGHTSSAFSGASFIHKRYGLKYAILPYIAAAYTGYIRVDSNRHYTKDVIAGAFIGIASSWYFTTPYKNIRINPVINNEYKGIQIKYKW